MEQASLRELITVFRPGRLDCIFVRPEKRRAVLSLNHAYAIKDCGIEDDHIAKRATGLPGGKRQVTLIQAEHLPTIAAFVRQASVDPALLRRNSSCQA